MDRLAAHLRTAPEDVPRVAGRVGGTLWLIAGASIFMLPAFPQVDTSLWPWPALWALGAFLWGLAAIFVIDWTRAPSWLMPSSTVLAPIAVALITQATGGTTSPALMFIFLALIFGACFLSVPWAIAVLTTSSLAWVVPTAVDSGIGPALAELLIAAPMFFAIGFVILNGRGLMVAMHDSAQRLSEEHDALRSIATAVAAGEDPERVCDLAAKEAARLVGGDGGAILQHDAESGDMTLVGSWRRVGARHPTGGPMTVIPGSFIERLWTTGEAQRVDDTRIADDGYAGALAARGYHGWAATPITVRGKLWGALAVTAIEANSLSSNAGDHLAEFAELIGMAVANTEKVERLSSDAATDPLTGLANHRAFQERLRQEIARRDRYGRDIAVALVDVDHFKAVNDTGGHATGDAVLRTVAEHLHEHLRGEDLLARVGGDEFAVLLPESDAASAAIALERGRRAIERASASDGAPVTISVGICDTVQADDAVALLRFADGALYWSKEHGRNRVSIYDPAVIQELSAAERIGALQRTQALAGIRALARAIDARDPTTREHSERVATLTAHMAEHRGWAAERVTLLYEAALVHDVGKIGMPDAILFKPGPLTPEEFEVISTHAELGARMVEENLGPEQADWILSHHERPDGAGYPRGLAGDEVSEGAGLLAAADAFDVMVAGRPYASGRSVEDALAECRDLVGRQFTTEAVDALEAVHGGTPPEQLLAAGT
ncbi:MAG: diguanylate cyclase [Solirubrobacteraceae bacterium]|nr:diguanylate cyclase [Solirubrobacteraceae bacterium]